LGGLKMTPSAERHDDDGGFGQRRGHRAGGGRTLAQKKMNPVIVTKITQS
jgi:hypothetical protein